MLVVVLDVHLQGIGDGRFTWYDAKVKPPVNLFDSVDIVFDRLAISSCMMAWSVGIGARLVRNLAITVQTHLWVTARHTMTVRQALKNGNGCNWSVQTL